MALRRPSRGPFQATKAASTLSQRRRRPSHRLSRQQRQKPASLRVHFPLPRRLDPVVADRAPTPVAFLTFSHHCPDRYPIRPRTRLILAMAAPAPGSLGGPQVALNPPRNDPISKARSIAIDVVLWIILSDSPGPNNRLISQRPTASEEVRSAACSDSVFGSHVHSPNFSSHLGRCQRLGIVHFQEVHCASLIHFALALQSFPPSPGHVFDVSSKPDMYGPSGACSFIHLA